MRPLEDVPIVPVETPLRPQKAHHVMSTDTPDRILRIATVLARTGLTRATLYRKVQNGTFPKQLKLSERCAGWRESAVSEWMKNPMHYSVHNS